MGTTLRFTNTEFTKIAAKAIGVYSAPLLPACVATKKLEAHYNFL